MKHTRKLVFAALMCALCCVASTVIKLPTPTMGYIHPGDGLVLLSGIILGPLAGGLAAGLGSALADLFAGYVSYAPATFLIKAASAAIAGALVPMLSKHIPGNAARRLPVILGGGVAELCMTAGYFAFEIFLMAFTATGRLSAASLAAGAVSAASGVPFNLVQGIFGVVIAALLHPAAKRLAADSDM